MRAKAVVMGMNRFTADRTFAVTYGPFPRIWCNRCDKATLLPGLDAETVRALEDSHRCGARTSPWDSAGAG